MITRTRILKTLAAMSIVCFSNGHDALAQYEENPAWKKFIKSGNQFFEHGQYADAEANFLLALAEAEKAEKAYMPVPLVDDLLRTSLMDLAEVYRRRGKFTEAESAYKRALTASERSNLFISQTLQKLAALYIAQRRYTDAEPLLRRVLELDDDDDDDGNKSRKTMVALDLDDLGALLTWEGKGSEADELYKRAMTIEEALYGPFPTDLVPDLNVLKRQYIRRGAEAAEKAGPIIKRELASTEKETTKASAEDTQLSDLAASYLANEVEVTARKALESKQKQLGPNDPDVAIKLTNLAAVYCAQGKYKPAEPLLKQALLTTEHMKGPYYNSFQSGPQLELKETSMGDTNPCVAKRLNNLAELYCAEGKYDQAEPLLKRSLQIIENTLGANHPYIASTLEIYVPLLRRTNRAVEADKLNAKIKSILPTQN